MKTLSFKIEDELHKKLRLKAIQKDKSVKKYLSELIEKDLEKEKE